METEATNMPIYALKCTTCNLGYEELMKMDENLPDCPKCGEIMKKDYKAMPPTAGTMKEHWFKGERIGRDRVDAKTYNDLEREAKKRGFEVITGKEGASK